VVLAVRCGAIAQMQRRPATATHPCLCRKCNVVSSVKFLRMTNPSSVDFPKFAGMLKTKRGVRGLRQAADEIGGVSASTLSRIEQGNVPDLETFMRICQWLGVSADEFRLNAPGDETTTMREPEEVIEAHLRADRTLPPDAIDALAQMIRFAYKAAKAGNLNDKED
jgi:transcriptional regulator with XRE-family HTH domain